MIVADASVVADFLLGPGTEAGEQLAAVLMEEIVCAPHLLDVEVGQVIRRYELRGELPVAGARDMLRDLVELPIVRYDHRPLVDRAFDLRANVTVYDGMYLALAELLDVRLLTGDVALASVPGATAHVELVSTVP